MNKEIKEKQLNEVLYGLDYIGNKIKNNDSKLELGVNNCKLLLDYITNLQKENEDLKADYGSKAQVERDILQNRIDKTIEYIQDGRCGDYCDGLSANGLICILQGDTDE